MLVHVGLLALPLALVVVGASMLYQRQVGAHARATITGCETDGGYKTYSQACTGTWTIEGRRVTGPSGMPTPGTSVTPST